MEVAQHVVEHPDGDVPECVCFLLKLATVVEFHRIVVAVDHVRRHDHEPALFERGS